MDLGQKLLELRKSKNLSQEEAAEKLDVTRQTISKWETNQSTPDFDKIIPICELYGIDSNELLSGVKKEKEVTDPKEVSAKRAGGIALSVFIYILALAWMPFSVAFLGLNPILCASIFLVIIGAATFLIIRTCLRYKVEKTKEEKEEDKVKNQINDILAIFTLLIYLFVSFKTGAWYITWLMWVIYGLVCRVISLIMMLRGDKNEK